MMLQLMIFNVTNVTRLGYEPTAIFLSWTGLPNFLDTMVLKLAPISSDQLLLLRLVLLH